MVKKDFILMPKQARKKILTDFRKSTEPIFNTFYVNSMLTTSQLSTISRSRYKRLKIFIFPLLTRPSRHVFHTLFRLQNPNGWKDLQTLTPLSSSFQGAPKVF